MKLLPSPQRIAAYAGALALVAGTAYATSLPTSANVEPTTEITTQMAEQDEKLKDHEDRISKVEATTAETKQTVVNLQNTVASQGQLIAEKLAPVPATEVTEPNLGDPAPKKMTKKVTGIDYDLAPGNMSCTYKFDDGSSVNVAGGVQLKVGDEVPNEWNAN